MLKNILISLSLIMWIPTAIATFGVISYDENSKYGIESLMISAYMIIFSSIIWLPYISIIVITWTKHTKKIKYTTMLPFIIMFIITTYLESKNFPW